MNFIDIEPKSLNIVEVENSLSLNIDNGETAEMLLNQLD